MMYMIPVYLSAFIQNGWQNSTIRSKRTLWWNIIINSPRIHVSSRLPQSPSASFGGFTPKASSTWNRSVFHSRKSLWEGFGIFLMNCLYKGNSHYSRFHRHSLDASTHLYKRVCPSVCPSRVFLNEPIMDENGRKWLGKSSKRSKLVKKSFWDI